MSERICAECDGLIVGRRSHARYCSPACRLTHQIKVAGERQKGAEWKAATLERRRGYGLAWRADNPEKVRSYNQASGARRSLNEAERKRLKLESWKT